MTHLFLENSKLIVGGDFDQHPEVNAILDDPALYPVVLYPGSESLNIETHSLPAHQKKTVIFVIDGTWAQAKTMLRRSTRLNLIPKICFTPSQPSLYTVRRQPDSHCLSTIEATQRLIQILEPEAPAAPLMRIFQKLVLFQMDCAKRNQLRETRL
jgi:DTW domain-containing protein YfiP